MDVVDVWEAEQDEGLEELTRTTRERSREPSFRGVILSSGGDTLGLQVVGEALPSGEARFLFVAGRGAYELTRVLLALRARASG